MQVSQLYKQELGKVSALHRHPVEASFNLAGEQCFVILAQGQHCLAAGLHGFCVSPSSSPRRAFQRAGRELRLFVQVLGALCIAAARGSVLG